jgi:hypothetical protein
MNLNNETEYRDRFIQAGKTNKLKFIEKLRWFKNTSNIAKFEEPLKLSFELLLNTNPEVEGCGCNKVIMIITDGASENAEEVFKKFNWENGRRVRVFTFLIGRDMTDPRQVEWMACANDGKYFHVATLADVNEHIHEYIPVLSRPMALMGVHETTWSNVFVGHLDKELKIAVARPAFKTKESLLAKVDLKKSEVKKKKKKIRKTTMPLPTTTVGYMLRDDGMSYDEYTQNDDDGYDSESGSNDESNNSNINENNENNENLDENEEAEASRSGESQTKREDIIDEQIDEAEPEELEEEHDHESTEKIIKTQQVLLGVVGVDVPVLRLISKVSPKYQMGVGIYIIMLDNNGFVVFHPSVKKEISKGEFDFKGTSHSIDLDKFEIPIGNDDDFEQLEHEMIDQMTGNKTLDNWKREGLRVIRRRTEYVYTSVSNTPFSVAIASPDSFGRYYIDLPSEKEKELEQRIRELLKNKYESNIQLYNCSYNYLKLSERLLHPKHFSDYCIRYLFQDPDQVLAIKYDLVMHDMYYNSYNFSIFTEHPNLVKSSFYGTYSGITFYLPVTVFRPKSNSSDASNSSSHSNASTSSTTHADSVHGTFVGGEATAGSVLIDNDYYEMYNQSLNLFSTESNKHTYSFEKHYYTRAIELTDYLRTQHKSNENMIIYFLNETSKDARLDTLNAAIPVWLEKVPAAVAGVVYDGRIIQDMLFNMPPLNCDSSDTCLNICNKQAMDINVTCYLVDEHGIVVLSSSEQHSIIGKPLYVINPWLMLQLEIEGVYDLIIPGNRLQDCSKPPKTISGASSITNFFGFVLKSLALALVNSLSLLLSFFLRLISSSFYYIVSSKDCYFSLLGIGVGSPYSPLAHAQSLASKMKKLEMINQNEFRIRNSHCSYFGIYSFNLIKWKSMDPTEIKTWCNSSALIQRSYMAGYVRNSNLLMLVVENEHEVSKCGAIEMLIKQRPPIWSSRLKATETQMSSSSNNDNNNSNKSEKKNYTINRYRKYPKYCHNYYPNETLVFSSSNKLNHFSLANLIKCSLIYLLVQAVLSG